MKVIHDGTIRITKGWQTILRIVKDDQEIGLVIRHDAPTSRVMASTIEIIEAAIAREVVIERRDLMNSEISMKIEESLIEWISNELNIEYRHVRWRHERMYNFDNRAEADEFELETQADRPPPAPVKKRIMLG